MAVASVIKLSELEGAKRIDAELYSPEIVTYKRRLQNHPKLKDLIEKIFHPKEIQRIYSETGFQFVLAQNVKNILMSFEEKAYISSDRAVLIQDNILRDGDCLIVRSGANYGDSSVYTSLDPKPAYASADVIVIRPKDLPGEFLTVFLNTEVGRLLLKNLGYGAGQPHIRPQEIKHLPIFRPQAKVIKEITNSVNEANRLNKEAEKYYSQAETLLLEELGLKDFKPKYEKTYTANLSYAFSAYRIDAEYFQPAYEEIIEYLKQRFKTEKLKNIVRFINHGKQPYYVEDGEIPVLIQKHLASQLLSLYSEIINMPDTPRTDRSFINQYPEYCLKFGDVLFYSVGAYLGRTNVVLEDFEAVPASFITLIRTKPEICVPDYLALFLNSRIGQLQSERWKSASAQQYIYPKEIKEFVIPILPIEISAKNRFISPAIARSKKESDSAFGRSKKAG